MRNLECLMQIDSSKVSMAILIFCESKLSEFLGLTVLNKFKSRLSVRLLKVRVNT